MKFKGLTYSMDIKVEKGYETMFTKVTHLSVSAFSAEHEEIHLS